MKKYVQDSCERRAHVRQHDSPTVFLTGSVNAFAMAAEELTYRLVPMEAGQEFVLDKIDDARKELNRLIGLVFVDH